MFSLLSIFNLYVLVCDCVMNVCMHVRMHVFLYVCVGGHILEWACIHIHVPMYAEVWGWWLGSSSIILPPCLLRQGLLMKPRVDCINMATLTSQLALRIPLSPLPQAGITGRLPCLTGILSISVDVHSSTGASTLTTEPFPSPREWFFK